MGQVKKILLSLFGLLVALIALMVLLRLAKKLPVVGKIAADAQSLATEGTIS